MTSVEEVARARVGDGHSVERLVCHPQLPLVAALDSERSTVQVWDCGSGRLTELGSVGTGSASDSDTSGWGRAKRPPAAAWHPAEPLLVVSGDGGTVKWTPSGSSDLESLLPTARYVDLAFSPNGHALWGTPSSRGKGEVWESSDVVELGSGAVSAGPRWDTGIVTHPGGGLVVTFASDQGATLGLFGRVDDAAPGVMHMVRKALILDVDGYEKPVFSADGRHFAIRGNAYGNTLEIFEFPSLQRILATSLGEPSQGYPPSDEWLEQMFAWSRHNITFGPQPGVLWIGTPTGTLVELDLESQSAVEHEVIPGSRISALAATASGELIVANSAGDLVLMHVAGDAAVDHRANAETARNAVAEFLDGTSDVPDDGDLDSHLVLTDGNRTWESEDLETVTTSEESDPTWLRLQAAVNTARGLNT